MLCTLTKEVIEDEKYLYELKWDGYRIISFVQKGKVRMDSRSALDYTLKYPILSQALRSLGHDLVVDGEVVVFNEEGRPDFDALQKYNGQETLLSYCLFDVLWMDGFDLKQLPLTERKKILQGLLKGNRILRYTDSFDEGQKLYDWVIDNNLEGIVAKLRDSPYVPGERGVKWLKTPTRKRQEFVIGGWSESDKNRVVPLSITGGYPGP